MSKFNSLVPGISITVEEYWSKYTSDTLDNAVSSYKKKDTYAHILKSNTIPFDSKLEIFDLTPKSVELYNALAKLEFYYLIIQKKDIITCIDEVFLSFDDAEDFLNTLD